MTLPFFRALSLGAPTRATGEPRKTRLALAWLFALLLPALAVGSSSAAAQDLASFEKDTTVHVLENGWTFIFVQRSGAPVFSFATYVDVGGAQEVPGITGLAHMFEHMAFKGTANIGTTDAAAEARALDALESAYQEWQTARFAGSGEEELARLRKRFEDAQTEAKKYVVTNEFADLVDQAGGVGLNASTTGDATRYYYSLPSNRFELFAFLESERFLRPVFREYYTERDVVMEERRMRTDSSAQGRLIEQFFAAAYEAHPYGQPVVGYMSDLQSITITDAREFFDRYYTPSNIVTTIVGRVDPKTAIPVLEKYFGRIPAGAKPEPLRTVEPKQRAGRLVTAVEAQAQPLYVEGYHKPAETHPDQPIYDALQDVLTNGRTSRLYRKLVRDDQSAAFIASLDGFPGPKYPNLLVIYGLPSPGVTPQELGEAIWLELQRIVEEGISAEELTRFKTRAKADFIRGLDGYTGLANQISEYHRLYGDWRELFKYLDRIDAVTAESVQRIAGELFEANNRTVAMIVQPPSSPEGGAKESAGGAQ